MSADTATARGRAGSYAGNGDDTAGLPIVSDGHGGWYGYAGADQGYAADGYATEYAPDYGYDAAHEFGYDTGYTGREPRAGSTTSPARCRSPPPATRRPPTARSPWTTSTSGTTSSRSPARRTSTAPSTAPPPPD